MALAGKESVRLHQRPRVRDRRYLYAVQRVMVNKEVEVVMEWGWDGTH